MISQQQKDLVFHILLAIVLPGVAAVYWTIRGGRYVYKRYTQIPQGTRQ